MNLNISDLINAKLKKGIFININLTALWRWITKNKKKENKENGKSKRDN